MLGLLKAREQKGMKVFREVTKLFQKRSSGKKNSRNGKTAGKGEATGEIIESWGELVIDWVWKL